jgi:hypothetical protein
MSGKAVSAGILLLALVLAAGCTLPQGGGVTPTPTTVRATMTSPTPVVTVPPGPVVTPPPQYAIAIQVTRNPSTANPYITVAFRGGNGQFILQQLTVTVARSDGLVIQEVIPETGNGQYAIGDSVNIMGTTGTDEVVVVATLNGVDYKIYDEFLTYGASP